MAENSEPDIFETGAVTKHFNAEYYPLEALLACIIDGQRALTSPPSRQIRIRDAFKALTDREIDRVDDPSGKHARALYRMAEYEYAVRLSQDLPEFGGSEGPPLEEEAAVALARRACEELGLPNSDTDILVRKFNARYGTDARARTEAYMMLPADRLYAFDADGERQMLDDFAVVGSILRKYGIDLELKDVFWRTVGNVSESVPSTT